MAEPRTPPPHPLALVVCDAVWTDPATGKRTILGTFTSVAVAGGRFPAAHPGVAVYAALTGLRPGPALIQVQSVDADAARDPVFRVDTVADVPGPLTVVEWAAAAPQVVFPAAGQYRVQLLADGALIAERRLDVFASAAPSDTAPGR